MGKNNSSLCRVKPFMDFLLEDIPRLILFLENLGIDVSDEIIKRENIFYDGHYGEKALKPPCDYLCKLIETLPNNFYAQEKIISSSDSKTRNIRMSLIKDKEMREKAINQIKEEYETYKDVLRGAIFLEGSSKPDVFIETDKTVIVVEGKWTEKIATENTAFVEHRNQMVRHIHDAINYIDVLKMEKKIYGFYIVTEEFAARSETAISKERFSEKLSEQFGVEGFEEQINAAYKGFVTWESIEKQFPNVGKRWKEKPD